MGRDAIVERFDGPLGARWTQTSLGGGLVRPAGGVLRLALPAGATARAYSDAQIEDYRGLPLAHFPWRPPLLLTVRARASHPAHPVDRFGARRDGVVDHEQRFLRGTAGFGFWNFPMTMGGGAPRLPDAVWFFAAAPPSNMALVPGVPGWGWKAQVVHAHRPGAVLAGAPALAAVVRGWMTGDDAAAARWVRRVAGASEMPLAVGFDEWHEYALEWRAHAARFRVDGEDVLLVPNPPRGPLGFIAWIDNQYAVATPRGALRFGIVETAAQWIELERLRIEPLE